MEGVLIQPFFNPEQIGFCCAFQELMVEFNLLKSTKNLTWRYKSMTQGKKTFLIVLAVGLAFILAGALVLFISASRPHYTATIREITDTYTTRQRTGSGKRTTRKFNEKVTVEYTDKNGILKEAANIRVKRSTESSLPQIGDTIEVAEGFQVKEYSLITPVAVFISFLIVGIGLIISGLRVRRQERKAQLMLK